MRRFPDWPSRLAAAVDAARAIPFGYGPGENHCCLFTGECVLAMTGRDPLVWFRGRYRTERGAYAALRRFGGGDVPEAMDRVSAEFPMLPVPVLRAGRGDVVMFTTPDGPALGICLGADLVSVTRPNGLAWIPMSAALAAWKV